MHLNTFKIIVATAVSATAHLVCRRWAAISEIGDDRSPPAGTELPSCL
jgi:hypothetical protein